MLDVQSTVEPPRPKVVLLSKSVQRGPALSAIRFGNEEELAQGARLTFFVKSEVPDKFSHSEKIEVATADESFHVLLSEADGNLILQDSQTALAIFDPAKSFGASTFGPLRFRPVDAEGTKGDLDASRKSGARAVTQGNSLPGQAGPAVQTERLEFIFDRFGRVRSGIRHTVPVPAGFADSTLSVPRPNGTLLYLKLRDDPATVNMMVLPVLPEE